MLYLQFAKTGMQKGGANILNSQNKLAKGAGQFLDKVWGREKAKS